MSQKSKIVFEVKNATQLNEFLTDVLMQTMGGDLPLDRVRGIVMVADKINKNNVNQLAYKRLSMHEKPIPFLEKG